MTQIEKRDIVKRLKAQIWYINRQGGSDKMQQALHELAGMTELLAALDIYTSYDLDVDRIVSANVLFPDDTEPLVIYRIDEERSVC